MTALPDDLLRETRWLARFARHLVAEDAADDLAQDVLMAALEGRPETDGGLRPWLATVARRLAGRRRHREGGRRDREHHAAAADCVPSAAAATERLLVQRSVVTALHELDEPYRYALVLRFWEDLPPREIAARTGVPVETVRTRIKRGLGRMRVRLDRQHGGRTAWAAPLMIGLPEPAAAAAATVGGATGLLGGTLVLNTKLSIALVAAAVVTVLVTAPLWWPASADVTTVADKAPAMVSTVAGEVARPAPPAVVGRNRQPIVDIDALPASTVIVRGRILDGVTGSPVADAEATFALSVGPSRVTGAVTVRSDRQGRIELAERTAVGDLGNVVRVSARDYASRFLILGLAGWQEGVTVEEDVGDVELWPGTAVRGRVVDTAGAALADAAVLLISGRSFRSLLSAEAMTRTSADGSFTVEERLAPEHFQHVLVAIAAQGVGWVHLQTRMQRSVMDDVQIQLQPSGSVTVRVVGGDGGPIAGARVRLIPGFAPLGDAEYRSSESDPRPQRFVADTDRHGMVTLAAIPAPSPSAGHAYRLQVRARGYAVAARDITLDAAKPRQLEVILEPEQRPLAGRVLDLGGAGIAAARVQIGAAQVESGAGGRFVFEEFSATEIAPYASVFAEGYLAFQDRIEIPALGEPLEITLQPSVVLEGRVVDQFGEGVDDAVVWVARPGHQVNEFTGFTMAGGFFQVAVPAGRLELRTQPPQTANKTRWDHAEITILEAPCDPVSLTMRRLAPGRTEFRARVVASEDGHPLDVKQCFVAQVEDGDWIDSLAADCSIGEAKASRLRAGRWIAVVETVGGRRCRHPFEVEVGQSLVEVRIELPAPATLTVRCDFGAAANGVLPDELTVLQQPMAARWESRPGVVELVQGSLRIPVSAATDWTLRLVHVTPDTEITLLVRERGWSGQVTVSVEPGSEESVSIPLRRAAVLRVEAAQPFAASDAILAVRPAGEPWRESNLSDRRGERVLCELTLQPGVFDWRLRYRAAGREISRQGRATLTAGETTVVLIE